MIKFNDLPRGLPGTNTSSDTAPRALWVDPKELSSHPNWTYEAGKVFLGSSCEKPIGLSDNRHLLTIAGSRTGKGTSAIVPNLLMYPGSVLVLDPKGENATLTAERRGKGRRIKDGGLCHDVYVIDPFGVAQVDQDYRAGFNPLAGLDPASDDCIDECDAIADALVVEEGNSNNRYFYDAARLALRVYIAFVAAYPQIKERSLNEVKRLIFAPRIAVDPDKYKDGSIPDINSPEICFDELNGLMAARPDFAFGIPYEAASMLLSLGDREFGSVMSTIQNQLGFISSPPMARTLAGGSRAPDLTTWKSGGSSVYLCLPAGRLHRHARFFRLFINRLMNAIETNPTVPDVPALMILDEMHVLGHMKALETAAGLIAGFGVRIWSFFQDLSQLKDIYGDRWETFLGNASVFQTFGLNDMGSLKYISERLGQSGMLKVSQGEQTTNQAAAGFTGQSRSVEGAPLLTPDEVAAFFSRQSGNQLIIYPGVSPIFLKRVPYTDTSFDDMRPQL
ncbi:type IV secretory system conjugative DNA transfer family protein [Fontisubflavum oceani]|uniref:type IV secretory system conjugative DNA transfer family protein n=1 Tax=Fontisubflavum oceani TaxID=2978973 RepID=UPI0025B375D2|nr:type IV secretory system conjugative DNA transfer family protein [Fontisubflavum oceani]WJY21588.1 type IV secretory system conjugative DNA transfer family protein [Fontisubflavum oceani]